MSVWARFRELRFDSMYNHTDRNLTCEAEWQWALVIVDTKWV